LRTPEVEPESSDENGFKRRRFVVAVSDVTLEGNGKRSLVYVAAAILVVGLVASAALVFSPLSRPPVTVTETFVTTTTSDVTLAPGCLANQGYGTFSGTLSTEFSFPAIICVQLYWFDSNSSIILNDPTSLLQIGGSVNGASNFTVNAYLPGCVSACQLGFIGPTGQGEGQLVAFGITANVGASGTYQLNFQSPSDVGTGPTPVQVYHLGPQGLEGCLGNVDLMAGNGQPNYVPPNEACPPVQIPGGGQFGIPGLGYKVPGDALLYRIVSMTNSSGYSGNP